MNNISEIRTQSIIKNGKAQLIQIKEQLLSCDDCCGSISIIKEVDAQGQTKENGHKETLELHSGSCRNSFNK